jgi:uncharacterized protein (DUF736 family)
VARLRLGLHGCNRPAKTISPPSSLRSAASSRSKFFSPPGSPLRFDRKRCSQPVPRRPDHNKDAMGANLVQPKGENIMANIGTFTADKDGFTGTLRTLTLNVKVKLLPNDKGSSENAPDFRLQAAGHDIGAAWNKTSEAGREYKSVTLDDPSFPAPIYARLIEGEDGTHDLIWSRTKPQAA